MNLRLGVSVAVWLLSLPALFFHAILASSALGIAAHPDAWPQISNGEDVWLLLSLPPSLFAWLALLWMDIQWINDQQVHWLWPVVGTVLALGWLIQPLPDVLALLMFVAPGICLAVFLVQWHLRGAPKPTSAPPIPAFTQPSDASKTSAPD